MSNTFLPDEHETETGHRCCTWHNYSGPGVKCLHGLVLLPHEIPIARLRADRIQTLAGSDV